MADKNGGVYRGGGPGKAGWMKNTKLQVHWLHARERLCFGFVTMELIKSQLCLSFVGCRSRSRVLFSVSVSCVVFCAFGKKNIFAFVLLAALSLIAIEQHCTGENGHAGTPSLRPR